MKILVTGGAGFIGSYTVDLLIEKGFDVRIFENFEPQVHGNKKPNYINDKAELVEGDITKKDSWKKILDGVDAVIHLAAMVGVGQSMYQPVRYLNVNTIATANMYEVIVENPELRKKIQKIVVASSKSLYGEGSYKCSEHGVVFPDNRSVGQLEKKDWEVFCPFCNNKAKPIGITEDKPPQNLSTYALSKYDTERIAVNFGNVLNIPTIAFRYFNVYGPRQSLSNPYTGVAAIFLSRIKNGNQPIIYEDGNQTRDFIYVEDIANANLLAIESLDISGVYNVGTGISVSIKDIAQTLIELNNSNVEPKITQSFRAGDNRHDFSNIDKIKKDLKFNVKWSLKDGMEKLVGWSQTQEAIDKFEEAEKERMKLIGG